MKIIFLTMTDIPDLEYRCIYTELLKVFIKKGHSVVIISPSDKINKKYEMIEYKDYRLIKIQLLKGMNTSLIKKGINTILLEKWYINSIKKFLIDECFDLVLYSTPPITLYRAIKYIKTKNKAISYLMLKDIFPQNALDLGMMTDKGLKSIIYHYFRKKEKQLYKLSDCIGCMSQANVDYVIKHNSEILPERVHVCPNSTEIRPKPGNSNKEKVRHKYGIPLNKTVFIYGGNLGRPQDIPFIIECLKVNEKYNDRYFVICGTGTEYPKLKKYVDEFNPQNVLLINGLPKDEYESLVSCCDVGLIFLDHRFTIPNFPSRLLSYMQNAMPVLACTDPNTDIGKVITEGNFGWWCESNNPDNFTKTVDKALQFDLQQIGKNGFEYLINNYSVENSYNIIMQRIEKRL